MEESFDQYLNRVSRSRHIYTTAIIHSDFTRGAAFGYKSSKEYFRADTGSNRIALAALEVMRGFSQRQSIAHKTWALIAQDRVLTYREEEL